MVQECEEEEEGGGGLGMYAASSLLALLRAGVVGGEEVLEAEGAALALATLLDR